MVPGMRLLLVEDDSMLGAATVQALRDAAHAVDWVREGPAALASVAAIDYDAILLDLGLPGLDGLEVLRALRARGHASPVLILTARDGVEERIRGLDLGADDYLVKPFAAGELLARLRAIVRRAGGQGRPALGNGLIELDPATREARCRGEAVRLSNREFALLHALLLRPGALLSRRELEERIYGWGEEVESNVVEFLIHSLRKKFGATAIKNVRGVGWCVDPESDAPTEGAGS